MRKITQFQITFGDCDPAGIVFYPNVYRWMDATFHDWLRPYGGHTQICRNLNAKGIGLIEARAKFARPMCDGDALFVRLAVESWDVRSLNLHYFGTVNGNDCFTAMERRALFIEADGRMKVGDIQAVRSVLEAHDEI